ncbi:MAG: nucleotidyltransferase domain-containing protein [Candidatus Methylumidiphilus sp.]
MRLSEFELQTIRNILYSADPQGRIYLFGSRTNDLRKGGDIDIFFEVTVPLDLKAQLSLEYNLSSLCNTKVDLLIKEPEQPEKTIYAIAREGIQL